MTAGTRRSPGEGSIYRRKDGLWTAAFSVAPGRRRTFYGKSRREVQEKLVAANRVKADRRAGATGVARAGRPAEGSPKDIRPVSAGRRAVPHPRPGELSRRSPSPGPGASVS